MLLHKNYNDRKEFYAGIQLQIQSVKVIKLKIRG